MYLDNREEVLKIVRENGRMLNFVSDDLKNDKQVVLEAISKDKKLYKYAGRKIRKEYPNVDKFLASAV